MKHFAVLLFLVCPILSLDAPNWTVGAKWIFWQEEYMPTPEEEYRVFIKEKDTLIQNRLCSQIWEKYVEVSGNMINEFPVQRHYLWQNEQKVEVYLPDSIQFFPLYDFGKTVGDTLLSYCYTLIGETVSLRIDSVTVSNEGSQSLKLQWVHPITFGTCYMNGPIYERIGSGDYLFPRNGHVDPPPGGGLICFSDSLLTFPAGANCSLTVGNSEPLTAETLKIFPNPTSDKLFFENENIEAIRIFNPFGQLLKAQNGGAEISLKEFSDGVYLLQIQTPKSIFLKKAIKRI